jgi:Fe-S-cluster containining protein
MAENAHFSSILSYPYSAEMDGRYFDIVAAVEAEFDRNRRLHGDRIRCSSGCTDCCYQRFEITDLDARNVVRGLSALPPHLRESIEQRARQYDESRRLPCPALHDGRCSIYEHRPVICRRFGMPIYNPDRPERILACELNFRAGEEVRDPDLIRIQTGIHQEWRDLQREYYSSARYRHPGPITVAGAIREAHLWTSELDD